MLRKLRRWSLLAVLAAVAADQALQWLALEDGEFRGRRVAPFDPPLFNASQEESLARLADFARGTDQWRRNVRLDPELGWSPRPSTEEERTGYDEHGARRDLTPLDPEAARLHHRIVAVGCSFTHGDEVPDEQTWAAHLETRVPAVEVANLGVGAYGLDQALLRLRRDGLRLRPDEVWLGWMPGATLRLTSLYPPALRHHDASVSCKPRFVLDPFAADGSGLALVPCPVASAEDLVRLLGDQRAFLAAVGAHDLWVGRAPAAYAPRGSHWSHASALARLLVTRAEAADRDPAPWLGRADSEPRRLVEALVRQVAREASAAGARFRLLVLPDRRELTRAAEGRRAWEGVVAALAADGIEILDATDALLAAGALDERAGWWMPGGHYSPRLNDTLAAFLADRLAPR